MPVSKQDFYTGSPSSSSPQESLFCISPHYPCTPNNFPVLFQTVPLLSSAPERTCGSQETCLRNVLKCSYLLWPFDPWRFQQLRWNETEKGPSHLCCQCLWMCPADKLSRTPGKQHEIKEESQKCRAGKLEIQCPATYLTQCSVPEQYPITHHKAHIPSHTT